MEQRAAADRPLREVGGNVAGEVQRLPSRPTHGTCDIIFVDCAAGVTDVQARTFYTPAPVDNLVL